MTLYQIIKGLPKDMPVKFYSVDWSDGATQQAYCDETTVGQILKDKTYNGYQREEGSVIVHNTYVEVLE